MRLSSPIVLIFLLFLFSPPALFPMEVFQYVDSSGTIHFTNVPTDPRYRRLKAEKRSVYQEKSHRQKIDSFIEREAKEQGLEPALVKAVIRAESDFDVQAISSAGAQGLMQLMPATAADLKMDDPFDPEENIRGGARYLRILLDLFEQDMKMAVAAYHAGPGNVLRHGKIPPIEETQLYVERVLRFYKIYSGKNSFPVYKGAVSSGETAILARTEPSPRVSLINVTK